MCPMLCCEEWENTACSFQILSTDTHTQIHNEECWSWTQKFCPFVTANLKQTTWPSLLENWLWTDKGPCKENKQRTPGCESEPNASQVGDPGQQATQVSSALKAPLSTQHMLPHLTLTTILWGGYHDPPFTNGKAQVTAKSGGSRIWIQCLVNIVSLMGFPWWLRR